MAVPKSWLTRPTWSGGLAERFYLRGGFRRPQLPFRRVREEIRTAPPAVRTAQRLEAKPERTVWLWPMVTLLAQKPAGAES